MIDIMPPLIFDFFLLFLPLLYPKLFLCNALGLGWKAHTVYHSIVSFDFCKFFLCDLLIGNSEINNGDRNVLTSIANTSFVLNYKSSTFIDT